MIRLIATDGNTDSRNSAAMTILKRRGDRPPRPIDQDVKPNATRTRSNTRSSTVMERIFSRAAAAILSADSVSSSGARVRDGG